MKRVLMVLLFLAVSLNMSFAQYTCDVQSKKKYDSVLNVLEFKKKEFRQMKPGELVVSVGKMFLNTEYVAGTLEHNKKEELVIDFNGLDCTTFLETVLALTLNVKNDLIDFESYRSQLKKIRYRDGEIKGYVSRLHYFSDWILNNQKKNYIKNLKFKKSSKLFVKQVNFMSTHTKAYPMLKGNISNIAAILSVEKGLKKSRLHFVQKDKFGEIESKIQNGDLIAFTSSVKGLDVSHVGIAVWEKGKLKLLHASLKNGVIISDKSILEFLESKRYTGVFVSRII